MVIANTEAIIKSLNGVNLNGALPETCHETSNDEDDFNELEKKRQRRRRK